MKADKRTRKGIQLYKLLYVMIGITLIMAGVFLWVFQGLRSNARALADSTENYIVFRKAIDEMAAASAYLTDQARSYATIGDPAYVKNYFTEKYETRRREDAVRLIETSIGDGPVLEQLKTAVRESQALESLELYSMALVIESMGQDFDDFPKDLKEVQLSEEDQALSDYEKWRKASMMLHSAEYNEYKYRIQSAVVLCTEALVDVTSRQQMAVAERLRQLMIAQSVMTAAIILMILLIALCIITQIIRPLQAIMEKIRTGQALPMKGAEELRAVSGIYNDVFSENRDIRDRLAYEASHDSLTGLLNRRSFESECSAITHNSYALLLIDVDFFKTVNDQYGHDTGDAILQKVAEVFRENARPDDLVCRIGGDEFAVIMRNISRKDSGRIREALERIRSTLRAADDGLPPVTLSMGLAFSDSREAESGLFKAADVALYRAKENGRNCFVIA